MASASTATNDPPRTDSDRLESCSIVSQTPADFAELAALVADHGTTGTAIYPSGGGTAWAYGHVPSRSGVRVETTKLDRVIDYPVDDMTITVEAGMTLARLQTILGEHNQYLPIDPPNAGQATLGGIMATGWTGPRRHANLKPRDQVIGIAFVDGLGRLVRGGGRVVKNVAGYDFPKLLTGSMGMLGVIAELTFKVRPRPESTAIAWVGLCDSRSLETLLDRLNLSETRPTAIEIMDRSRAEAVGGPAGLKASAWVAAIGFDESAKAVAWQCERIRSELPEGATCDIVRDADAAPVWAGLTEGFATAGDDSLTVARVVTRPGRLASLLAGLEGTAWSMQAHGGQGIAMLRAREPVTRDAALALAHAWHEAVAPWGGSVTWPASPADWGADFPVWGKPRPEWAVMAGIKQALDPKGILNPGRFPGVG